jgi:hypothetical protein
LALGDDDGSAASRPLRFFRCHISRQCPSSHVSTSSYKPHRYPPYDLPAPLRSTVRTSVLSNQGLRKSVSWLPRPTMNCPSRTDEDLLFHPGWNQSPPRFAADLTTCEDLNGIANARELGEADRLRSTRSLNPCQFEETSGQEIEKRKPIKMGEGVKGSTGMLQLSNGLLEGKLTPFRTLHPNNHACERDHS